MQENDTLLVHPFPPLCSPDARVLILGSFPSVVSRQQSFYYANPTNRFWPVLAEVFGETITDRRQFCRDHHIALWDVIASCRIHASDDSSIRDVTVNDINELVQGTDIRQIYTTGRRAWALYSRYVRCSLPAECLPSTSSANARLKLSDLAEAYQVIRNAAEKES